MKLLLWSKLHREEFQLDRALRGGGETLLRGECELTSNRGGLNQGYRPYLANPKPSKLLPGWSGEGGLWPPLQLWVCERATENSSSTTVRNL